METEVANRHNLSPRKQTGHPVRELATEMSRIESSYASLDVMLNWLSAQVQGRQKDEREKTPFPTVD